MHKAKFIPYNFSFKLLEQVWITNKTFLNLNFRYVMFQNFDYLYRIRFSSNV